MIIVYVANIFLRSGQSLLFKDFFGWVLIALCSMTIFYNMYQVISEIVGQLKEDFFNKDTKKREKKTVEERLKARKQLLEVSKT